MAFVATHLALYREDAPQPEHSLRAVLNDLRYIVSSGNQRRFMPHDLPPWQVVYNERQVGCFETIVEDVRSLLREFAGREAKPTAVILDNRTLPSPPQSGLPWP